MALIIILSIALLGLLGTLLFLAGAARMNRHYDEAMRDCMKRREEERYGKWK